MPKPILRHHHLDPVIRIKMHLDIAQTVWRVFRDIHYGFLRRWEGAQIALLLVVFPCHSRFKTGTPAFRNTDATGLRPTTTFRTDIVTTAAVDRKARDG